jgi:hypothetical protein
MALNEDSSENKNPLNKVSTYFEVLKIRRPQLQLKKDNKFLKESDLTDRQEESIKILSSSIGKQNQKDDFKEKSSKKNNKAEINNRNKEKFLQDFPQQRRYYLKKDAKNKKEDQRRIHPSKNFVSFLCNLMMIICTIISIFTTRTLSEEYFIRKNMIDIFEAESQYSVDDSKVSQLVPFS